MSISGLVALLLASSNNEYPQIFPGGGALIAWLVCNGRKRQPIGGWLMFYYWQIYGGLLITLVFLGMGLQTYVPESFDDRHLYFLSLISLLPSLIVLALEVAVATMLVSVHTWDLLRLLRGLMIAGLIFAVTGTLIDVNYFQDNLPFDALTIISGAVWLAYFFRSRRVKHIFMLHDWPTVVDTWYPPKPSALA